VIKIEGDRTFSVAAVNATALNFYGRYELNQAPAPLLVGFLTATVIPLVLSLAGLRAPLLGLPSRVGLGGHGFATHSTKHRSAPEAIESFATLAGGVGALEPPHSFFVELAGFLL